MKQNPTLIWIQIDVTIGCGVGCRPASHSCGVAQRGGREVPRNSEKRVMKLSGILSGAVVLLVLASVAPPVRADRCGQKWNAAHRPFSIGAIGHRPLGRRLRN
jgi:hypothetical protein